MPEPFSIIPLTPDGRGGIGSLLISGPGAEEAFRTLFTFPSGRAPTADDLAARRSRPIYGHFSLGEGLHEEVLVRAVSPEKLEIHSHGGSAVRRAVVRRLTESGGVFRPDEPPVWEGPADGEPDFRAEAARLLPYARTERAARLLLEQESAAGRFFARLETLDRAARAECLARAELLARVGKSLYAPPHVLLIGPVNAGKSSLLNALLGFGRVLVDQRAGTTRDAVSVETVIDGFPLRLSDTAGVREGAGRLEREGIGRIVPLLDKADLLLTVYDITAPGTDPVAEFTRALRAAGGVFPRGGTPSLLVLNKCDIPRKERNRFWQTAPRGRNTIETSVFQPGTIVDLQKRLIGILFPAIPETGEFVPLNARQLSYTRARCR